MSTGSKAPKKPRHKYAPRVVHGGNGFRVISGCTCGWLGDDNYRGMARDQWTDHRRQQT